jgi:signal transduction histidine kinase
MNDSSNRRILVIDDAEGVLADFRKILAPPSEKNDLKLKRQELFGGGQSDAQRRHPPFELTTAMQGEQGLEALKRARAEKRPFALAFVDIRMPPGWDGVETIQRLWKEDPALQVVICTAYSDCSWDEMIERLGSTDRLLILKKPFDPIEVLQLATALTAKWEAVSQTQQQLEQLRAKEQEARAYATAMGTLNQALKTAKAAAESSAEFQQDFLVNLSEGIRDRLNEMLAVLSNERGDPTAPEPDLDSLDRVIESAQHLLITLTGILAVSQLESKEVVREVPFSPSAAANNACERSRSLAQRKSLSIECTLDERLPEEFRGDQERIELILQQLLCDAIDHAEAGPLVLAVGVDYEHGWESPAMRFSVGYNGAGDDSVGLTITRQLARLLGGDLEVVKEDSRHTRLVLTLGG